VFLVKKHPYPCSWTNRSSNLSLPFTLRRQFDTPDTYWNELSVWTFHSRSMEKPPTNFISTMDLGATMHRDMIYHATCKHSSIYAGGRGRKRQLLDLSRETAVPSRHNTYAIETNVERCLLYISSNVQKDSSLSSNGERRGAYPQPAKSTKYTQNTHFRTKIDTTKPI
jgi:hypothetical protein